MRRLKPILLALLSLPGSAQSDPPNLLSLQLRLADALGAPLAGPVSLDLRLYDAASAGNLLWAESQSATALDGVVAVQLGATTVLPADLFQGGERFLGLSVEGDPEMVPRTKIASAPYARRAASVAALDAATVVPDGFVGPTAIADGAISGAKLAAGSVTSVNLAPGAVGPAALGDDAVDATKLAPGAVSSTALAAGSVLGSHVANGTLTDSDLASTAAIQGSKVVPSFGAQDVTTTGRLGVGTTSFEPGADLQVRGDTSLGEILVTPTGTNSSAQVRMTENFTASLGMIQRYDGTFNQWQIRGQNTSGVTGPHLVVERDLGEVGIGTSSPQARLHVDGDLRVDGSAGDAAVRLPQSSVSPAETLAEPGLASIAELKDDTVLAIAEDPFETILASRTITPPADGFVVALAECNALMLIGSGDDYTFSISRVSTVHDSDNLVHLDFASSTRQMVGRQAVFAVSKDDPTTFHFLASKPLGEPALFAGDVRLTLMFFPSAYGTVEVD